MENGEIDVSETPIDSYDFYNSNDDSNESNDSYQSKLPTNPAKPKTSLKIPPWGWAVLVIGVVLIIAAAVTIPILLTRTSSSSSTSTSVTVIPTVTTVIPSYPTRTAKFQTIVPSVDGITKSRYQFGQQADSKLSFIGVGSNSKTAFYVVDASTGVITGPSQIGSTNTVQANAFPVPRQDAWNVYLSPENILCYGDINNAVVTCSSLLVFNLMDYNPAILAASWFNADNLLSATDTQNRFTIQNGSGVELCNGSTSTPTPVLTTIFTNKVDATFSLFGVVTSNTIQYVVYRPNSNCETTFSIPLTHTIKDAQTTLDGQYLLVLTDQQLLMYKLDTSTFKYTLMDTIPIDTGSNHCSMSSNLANTIYAHISTSSSFTIVVPFSTSKQVFQPQLGFQVNILTSDLASANGPCAIQVDATNFVLIQSDILSHAQISIVGI